jgi:hypothetical protein
MPPGVPDHRRPLIISIICVFFFVSLAISLYPYWRDLPTIRYRYGLGYAIYLVTNYLLSILCFIGFWRMARWSVYLYAALVGAQYAIQYLYQFEFYPWAVPIAALVFFTGLAYYRRMQWRL